MLCTCRQRSLGPCFPLLPVGDAVYGNAQPWYTWPATWLHRLLGMPGDCVSAHATSRCQCLCTCGFQTSPLTERQPGCSVQKSYSSLSPGTLGPQGALPRSTGALTALLTPHGLVWLCLPAASASQLCRPCMRNGPDRVLVWVGLLSWVSMAIFPQPPGGLNPLSWWALPCALWGGLSGCAGPIQVLPQPQRTRFPRAL